MPALQVTFNPVPVAYSESGPCDQPKAIFRTTNDGDIGFDPAVLVTQLRIGCTTRFPVYIGHRQVLQEFAGLASADFKFGER